MEFTFFIEFKIFKVINTFKKAVSCYIQRSIGQSYMVKRSFYYHVQPCLVFIGTDRLISEYCYKGTILQT